MEMLMSIRQEMEARDEQLRTQLQIRADYFDAKLKRRD